VRDLETLREERRLRPLACAGRPEQDDHGHPRTLVPSIWAATPGAVTG
jgi:hypothetical protein